MRQFKLAGMSYAGRIRGISAGFAGGQRGGKGRIISHAQPAGFFM